MTENFLLQNIMHRLILLPLLSTESKLLIYLVLEFWLGLVWFNGISTIVGYSMPNPVFIYIKYMICKHILSVHTVKWSNSSISNNSI